MKPEVTYSRYNDILTALGFLVSLQMARRLAKYGHFFAGCPCSSSWSQLRKQNKGHWNFQKHPFLGVHCSRVFENRASPKGWWTNPFTTTDARNSCLGPIIWEFRASQVAGFFPPTVLCFWKGTRVVRWRYKTPCGWLRVFTSQTYSPLVKRMGWSWKYLANLGGDRKFPELFWNQGASKKAFSIWSKVITLYIYIYIYIYISFVFVSFHESWSLDRSGFVWLNRGTSRRSRLRPKGAKRKQASVRRANKIVKRLCFLSLGCVEYTWSI